MVASNPDYTSVQFLPWPTVSGMKLFHTDSPECAVRVLAILDKQIADLDIYIVENGITESLSVQRLQLQRLYERLAKVASRRQPVDGQAMPELDMQYKQQLDDLLGEFS